MRKEKCGQPNEEKLATTCSSWVDRQMVPVKKESCCKILNWRYSNRPLFGRFTSGPCLCGIFFTNNEFSITAYFSTQILTLSSLLHSNPRSSILEALSSPSGGGSAQAQPKGLGVGDRGICGIGRVISTGEGRRGVDGPEMEAGNKETKRRGEARPTRNVVGDIFGGISHHHRPTWMPVLTKMQWRADGHTVFKGWLMTGNGLTHSSHNYRAYIPRVWTVFRLYRA